MTKGRIANPCLQALGWHIRGDENDNKTRNFTK